MLSELRMGTAGDVETGEGASEHEQYRKCNQISCMDIGII